MADKITWANEKRKLSELVPWERNPRQITDKQAKRLEESFEQFGQVEIIAIGPGNEIYNGHQRLKVLSQKYGADYEVDVRVASRALTEKEREKLTIFLHKGAAGDWDFDVLANEFELDDLLNWGFEPKELDLDLWAGDPPEDVEPQIDKAEELREKWGVELGQLWKLGEHRLICGDCTDKAVVDRVMGGERADMVFTDPPYGMDLETDYAKINQESTIVKSNTYERVIGDNLEFDPRNLIEYFGNCEQFWWGGDWYYSRLPDGGSWMVWNKKDAEGAEKMIGNHFEMLWSRIQHRRVVFNRLWAGFTARNREFTRIHPTEKPIDILEKVIEEYCIDDGIVADPFLGSGTTLIACERLGRKCRAVEISPAYVAVAIQRWVDVTGGTPELVEPVMQVEAD